MLSGMTKARMRVASALGARVSKPPLARAGAISSGSSLAAPRDVALRLAKAGYPHGLLAAAVVLLVPLLLVVARPASAAPVIGAAAGPGMAFSVKTKSSTTQSRNADANSTSESVVAFDVHQDASGLSVTATMLSSTATMGGTPVPDSFTGLMLNIPLTLVVNKDFMAVDVEGVDDAMAVVKKRVGEAAFAQLSMLLSPDVLKSQTMGEWNALYGTFRGLTAQVGSAMTMTRQLTLPGGDLMPFTATAKVTSLTTRAGRPCAVVSVQGQLASAQMLKAYQDFYARVEMKVPSVSMTYAGNWTVDLANGLPYSSTEKQVVKTKLDYGSGAPVEAVTTDVAERSTTLK